MFSCSFFFIVPPPRALFPHELPSRPRFFNYAPGHVYFVNSRLAAHRRSGRDDDQSIEFVDHDSYPYFHHTAINSVTSTDKTTPLMYATKCSQYTQPSRSMNEFFFFPPSFVFGFNSRLLPYFGTNPKSHEGSHLSLGAYRTFRHCTVD